MKFGEGEKMLEDRGFSTREDAGKLGFRYARRCRTSEVDDLSRKQRSGTQVITGKRIPVAQVAAAESVAQMLAGSQEDKW